MWACVLTRVGGVVPRWTPELAAPAPVVVVGAGVVVVVGVDVGVVRVSALRRACTGGGELGGDSPGVPESGLSQGGGDPVLLRGEDAPEAEGSDRGVFLGEGERVNTSAEDEDRTES